MRLCWNEKKNGFVVICYLSMLIFFYSFYKIKDRNGNGSIIIYIYFHHLLIKKFQIFFFVVVYVVINRSIEHPEFP